MIKIKEIHAQLIKNPDEYRDIKYLVSKRIFAIVVSLYLLATLFTVGGFYFWFFSIHTLSMISYHLYSLVIIATIFFWYNILENIVSIYVPEKRWVLAVFGILLLIFWIAALIAHLGLLSFFSF